MGQGKLRKRFSIVLPIAQTAEYANVLMTALLGTRQLAFEHPDLVRGIIAALNRAIFEIRFERLEVIEFASNHFAVDRDVIREALREVNNASLYATDGCVMWHAAWERTSNAYFQSLKHVLSTHTVSAMSSDAYRRLVEPYHHFVELAGNASLVRKPGWARRASHRKTMQKKQIRLYQTGFQFLYLPIYYAISKHFLD